jgi:hypothetical protein
MHHNVDEQGPPKRETQGGNPAHPALRMALSAGIWKQNITQVE